jgi:DtxR family transcriptional regulator, Mn-dependent transcriptional regulator
MLSQAVQDYLKAIYKLQVDGLVSTTEISKEMNVSGASVTGMLKRLANMNLVDYNSYKGVKLTKSGEKIALEIIRHHRLLELYLKEVMGFSLEQVHDEACRLEHYISDEFGDKIDTMLGNPTFDPHGHPIPSKNGKMPIIKECKLIDCTVGTNVIIKRLADDDKKLLGYLEEHRFLPGINLNIVEKAPFNGPITVLKEGEKEIIGFEISKKIFVENAHES